MMSRHLNDVAVELFAAYDLAIQRAATVERTGPSRGLYCVASIGYVGQGLRGVLVLAANENAVDAWRAATGVEECDVADTVGEFSNMMLGRLKGRLLCEGIPISLATPVTVCGAGLHSSIPPGQSNWQFFDGPGWQMRTRLDVMFEEGFAQQETNDQAQPATAGDAILF
jgi:hypothetical protein